MSLKVDCAPKITRVHNLHRIRTIVNYVNALDKKKAETIDDIAVANHLIKTHLSKPTTEVFRDQIGRRARDHLETGRYLGLLYRQKIGYKFRHMPTFLGKRLLTYSFEEECPKDYKEEAIMIDRICRMKFTNTSYMQTPRGYENFRQRICLNILASLYLNNSAISVFQLGTILSKQILDIFFHKKDFESIINTINSKAYKEKYLDKLSSIDMRNIRRDTVPFIDWCAQLDLVRKKDDIVILTERGKEVFEFYSKMMPIWWHDISEWPKAVGAILLLMNYFKIKSKGFLIKKLIQRGVKFGLFDISIKKIIKKTLKEYYEASIESNLLFDFSFQYDIPPKYLQDTLNIMDSLLNEIRYDKTALNVIEHLEFYFMRRIATKLKKESVQISKGITDKQQIEIKVLATSILSQFKSPYEATTYIHFKAIEAENFKVDKYQAQLSEFFVDKPQYKSFSKNNPDLILTNDFLGLVECKSTKEWGDTLSLRKGIISEIEFYHHYCNEIKDLGINDNCLAIICYEGQIKTEDKSEVVQLIKEKYPNIVIVTSSILQKALIDNSTKNALKAIIKGTEKSVML